MASHARHRWQETLQIAIICARPAEFDAIILQCEEIWEDNKARDKAADNSEYRLGRMGGIPVVLLLLPNLGRASTTSAIAGLQSFFPGINLVIVIGVYIGMRRVGIKNKVLYGDGAISNNGLHYYFRRNDSRILSLLANLATGPHHGSLQARAGHVLEQVQLRAPSPSQVLCVSSLMEYDPLSSDFIFKQVLAYTKPITPREKSVDFAKRSSSNSSSIVSKIKAAGMMDAFSTAPQILNNAAAAAADDDDDWLIIDHEPLGSDVPVAANSAASEDMLEYVGELVLPWRARSFQARQPCSIGRSRDLDHGEWHPVCSPSWEYDIEPDAWEPPNPALMRQFRRLLTMEINDDTDMKALISKEKEPDPDDEKDEECRILFPVRSPFQDLATRLGLPLTAAGEVETPVSKDVVSFSGRHQISVQVENDDQIRLQKIIESLRFKKIQEAAISYLAELLASDPNLFPLYDKSPQLLKGERFIQNHARLLKSYHLSLRSQTCNRRQDVAVNLLEPREHRTLISKRIRESIGSYNTIKGKAYAEQRSERNLTLARFLIIMGHKSRKVSDAMPDVWNEDSHEEYDMVSILNCLNEIKQLFTSGRPLLELAASLRNFVDSNDESKKQAEKLKAKPERSTVVHWGTMLFARLFDKWSPPQPGLQRVRYNCDCGAYTFLDVKELSPGGVARFRQQLAENGLTHAVTTPEGSTEVRSGLHPPPPAYLGAERSRSMSLQSSRSRSSSRSNLSTQPSSISWPEEETPPQDEETIPQYLLLCINQKRLSELTQIDCRPFKNDQYLCQQILKQYQITRAKATWNPSLLLPVSFLGLLSSVSVLLEQKTSNWLGWIFRFFRSFSDTSFFEIDTGDFVRFQLVPVGLDAVPTHFKCAEFPPESEVIAGKYLYEPVPMTDVAPASIPLWHLTKPGPHSDMYWIRTFPKKLGCKLDRRPGDRDPAIGWGIRVNESFNWRHFLFLILTFSISISIIVGIYVAVTSDASSAFGLGAFLAALVAIYIPHQYFAWKERLS